VVPRLLAAAECLALRDLCARGDLFRSHIVMARHRFRKGEYVYFRYPLPDTVARLHTTLFTIFNKWLPESDYKLADGPEFERYGETFDPRTGTGGLVEIWIPIKLRARQYPQASSTCRV